MCIFFISISSCGYAFIEEDEEDEEDKEEGNKKKKKKGPGRGRPYSTKFFSFLPSSRTKQRPRLMATRAPRGDQTGVWF